MKSEALVSMMTYGRPTVLTTDGYKFSMGQAGFPLREETFSLTFRKGGPFYIPVDLEEVVRLLLPSPVDKDTQTHLLTWGYGLTQGMQAALSSVHQDALRVLAAPKGSWVLAGEPILTVTGASFLVSWLEPLLISLHKLVQWATAMKMGVTEFEPVNLEENFILEELASDLGLTLKLRPYKDAQRDFRTTVMNRLAELRTISNAHRYFEVGMRSYLTQTQHRLVLKMCQDFGWTKTSNVALARELDMMPVGTTGHEHQMRWGDDLTAFRAVRDMRPTPPSYLFDTYDPLRLGLPAAIQALVECPHREASIRFDSGDQVAQLHVLASLEKEHKVAPNIILEDGYDFERTKLMLQEASRLGIQNRVSFGFGGYLNPGDYSRDKVAAVYKLTESCGPRMKFSGDPGKQSVPGRPVIFRSHDGTEGLIGQEGETISGFHQLSGRGKPLNEGPPHKYTKLSPATIHMIQAQGAMLSKKLQENL